jgi:processive 1,2-diacylglycerol beta-glucosyltransferase
MPRILILTAGYGEGHNSAAHALHAALAEQPGIEPELIDLFALRAPRLNNLTRRGYLKLINTAPRLWSGIYRWLDRSPHAPAALGPLASHRRLLARLIAAKEPVAILSTYPVYGWLLNQLRSEGAAICPHFTVVTDAITINSLWFRTPAAGWFVTDRDSAALLRERGLPGDRVHVSGFPVALAFADRPATLAPPDPASPGQPRRILFMINTSLRSSLPVARALLRERDWQITFTTGRDPRVRTAIERLVRESGATAEVLGWTKRIPELLMTHHVAISKAGGATTQESINALCPLIVSQIVPGQEEGNYELLQRHGSGALATTPEAIVAQIRSAFANDALLWRRWRENLRQLARPAAARDIAARVLAEVAQPAAVR